MNIPFQDYLKSYKTNLNNICIQLIDICSNRKDSHQLKIWMGPHLPNMILTKIQQKQFNQIIVHTNKITIRYGFRTFKRNIFWEKTHHDLLLKNSHYFSPNGIRLMSQFLAEIIGKRRHRLFKK